MKFKGCSTAINSFSSTPLFKGGVGGKGPAAFDALEETQMR